MFSKLRPIVYLLYPEAQTFSLSTCDIIRRVVAKEGKKLIRVKLWSLDKDEGDHLQPVSLTEVREAETENQLEDILVSSPNLLMTGLKLVGRQVATEGGPLDLLGVDEDGNLIVFELKRGTLARDAVAQVIDYASFLGELDKETLFKHISDRSGYGEIEKIDFENWYLEQFSGNLDALDNSPKMVLVGLGADNRTRRMVNYLSKNGLDISLITFYAFRKGQEVFLAKQVEIELQEKDAAQKYSYTKEANEESLRRLAEKIQAMEILDRITELIRNTLTSGYEWPGKTGRSFSFLEKTEEGRPTYRVYLSLYLDESWPNSVRVFFQPRAIEVAEDEFKNLKEKYKGLADAKHGGLYIRLDKESQQLDNFCPDLENLLGKIEAGWKIKQTQRERQ